MARATGIGEGGAPAGETVEGSDRQEASPPPSQPRTRPGLSPSLRSKAETARPFVRAALQFPPLWTLTKKPFSQAPHNGGPKRLSARSASFSLPSLWGTKARAGGGGRMDGRGQPHLFPSHLGQPRAITPSLPFLKSFYLPPPPWPGGTPLALKGKASHLQAARRGSALPGQALPRLQKPERGK